MSHAIESATLPSQIVFLEQFPRKTQYTQQAFVDQYVKGLADGGEAELMAINQSEFPSAAPLFYLSSVKHLHNALTIGHITAG